jgi:hypothetical protein
LKINKTMEPAKDNGKKNEKKEESSENEIKEVKSELKEQRLDQIRRFEELLNGVRLT